MYLTSKAYPKRAARTAANSAFLSALCLTVLFLSSTRVHAQRFVKVVDTIDQLVRLNPNDVNTNVFVADPNRGGLFTLAPRGTTNSGTVFASTNALRQWNRQDSAGEFNVRWFGAAGDGAADDTTEIQAAIDAAELVGGTVVFPRGVYRVTSELIVASLKPVTLRARSYGYHHFDQDIPCILLGANITNLLTSQSPTGTRDNGAGVVLQGLAFRDETATISAVGTFTVSGAVVYLKDANMSLIENCVFEGFNGTVILTEFTVSSKILNNVIRFSGNSTKPVIDLSEAGAFTTQGLLLEGNILEVNHGEYVRVRQVGDVRICKNQFEAETSIGTSSQTFIYDEGLNTAMDLNVFNRNTNVQVVLAPASLKALLTGNTFAGGVNPVEALRTEGLFANVSGNNRFNSGKTANEVLDTGLYNRVEGNVFINSGGIKSTGANFEFNYNLWFTDGGCTNAYIVDLGQNSVSCMGNTLSGGLNGGILVSSNSTLTKVHGNTVRNFGGIGIRIETSAPSVKDNVSYQNAGGNFSTVHAAETILDNYFANEPWLEARATWNPPALASGQLRSVDVTVVGAALGDVAEASFGTPQNGNYLMPANVIGIDTVRVFLWNLQNSASDFASGDLHVRVRKRSAVAIYGTVTDNADVSPIFALQGAVDAKQDAFATAVGVTNIANVLSGNYVAGTNVVGITNANGQVSWNVPTADTDGFTLLPIVTTTDGTLTPIYTNAIPNNTMVVVHGEVEAIDETRAHVRHVAFQFLANNNAGTLDVTATSFQSQVWFNDGVQYAVTAAADGTSIVVTVENNAGTPNTVKWQMRYKVVTHSF